MAATLTGPLDGGKHGWAFGAHLPDLSDRGYQEREYLLSGDATSYRATSPVTPDGHWATEQAENAPFTTRLLVRRPVDPARFNGVVVVEWVNVTSGFDLSVGAGPDLFDEGFAHVIVSAQYAGAVGFESNPMGLRAWDPERYEAISHPGDKYSYGIFSAAARAVGPGRATGPGDPLAGLVVTSLVALGASQSGQRLLAYVNAVQPHERVFDGFLSTISIGKAHGLDNTLVDPSRLATADLTDAEQAAIHGTPSRFRTDLEAPVFVVNSECETRTYRRSQQVDTDSYRFWEVAGASHAPAGMMARSAALMARDFQLPTVMGAGLVAADIPPSTVEWLPTASAALGHLRRWVLDGIAPPVQPLIELDGSGRIVRDEDGNARGGIRLPDVDVPLAGYEGGGIPPDAVGLGGRTTPFTAEQIAARYPSHDEYVEKVRAAAAAAVAAGVILPTRAAQYGAAAEAAPVPR